jgi:hypothetical protein
MTAFEDHVPARRHDERAREEREGPLHQAARRDEDEGREREGHRDVEAANHEEARPEEIEEPGDGVEARRGIDGVDVAVEDLAGGESARAVREMALVDEPDALTKQHRLIGEPQPEEQEQGHSIAPALHRLPHGAAPTRSPRTSVEQRRQSTPGVFRSPSDPHRSPRVSGLSSPGCPRPNPRRRARLRRPKSSRRDAA